MGQTLKLFSWNVNGFRAAIKKGFWEKMNQMDLDLISLQETKSDSEVMSSKAVQNPSFDLEFFSCSMKKGYSGVATLTRNGKKETLPDDDLFELDDKNVEETQENKLILKSVQKGLGIEEFDVEGRMLITQYVVRDSDFEFTLLNGYFPQGGRGQYRIDYKIKFYEAVFKLADKLRNEGQNVIICGDLNTTVGDIDLARPKENRKTTGCLPEEREALDLFLKNGFVDSFRHFYPDLPGKYSYWDQITRARERNVGWRIDYFLVDEKLLPKLKNAEIHDQVFGSDHCPVSIEFDLG